MNVDKINIQATSFKSEFVPNKILEQTFNRAAREKDRMFAKNIKALLNDGKKDVLELRQKNDKSICLYVNDKMIDEKDTYLNYYGNAGTELINNYAAKTESSISGKTNKFSEEEVKLIKEDVNVIKFLLDNFEDNFNFVSSIKQRLNNIKQSLEENTQQKILEIKDIIFKK